MSSKTIERIKKISQDLLRKEHLTKDNFIVEKDGFRLTNAFSPNVLPLGMLSGSQEEYLRDIFRRDFDKYYYVERI